jgi:hypothetical protein
MMDLYPCRAFASNCDVGAYAGCVLGYDATTLQRTGAFNAALPGCLAGIWQGGAGVRKQEFELPSPVQWLTHCVAADATNAAVTNALGTCTSTGVSCLLLSACKQAAGALETALQGELDAFKPQVAC